MLMVSMRGANPRPQTESRRREVNGVFNTRETVCKYENIDYPVEEQPATTHIEIMASTTGKVQEPGGVAEQVRYYTAATGT